jgi:hypothetical protein
LFFISFACFLDAMLSCINNEIFAWIHKFRSLLEWFWGSLTLLGEEVGLTVECCIVI